MPLSGAMRAQIGTLIVATSAIQLGNGFFGTFISLRVPIEHFGTIVAGLVLSSYFAGFTLGALLCSRIIERVGHIRAYAAFAGLAVAATAAMPLLVGPLSWMILRGVIGFGCAGLFVATESWLNAKPSRLRGDGSSQPIWWARSLPSRLANSSLPGPRSRRRRRS
jgi:MFS family permease